MPSPQPFRWTWIAAGLIVLTLAIGGCYSSRDDATGEPAPVDGRDATNESGADDLRARTDADVVIRFGGQKAGVPDSVDFVELRVSGPEFGQPFSERFEVNAGQDLVISETFPVGPDVLFEVDALEDLTEATRLLYSGSTVTDLVPGENDVSVLMEGRASISGSIYFLDGDGFDVDFGNPLADHTETEGPVAFTTDAAGSFYLDVATGPDPIRIEANPGSCPVSQEFSPGTEWADCYALAEVVLDVPGDSVFLTLYVVPNDPAIFGNRPYASSVVPSTVAVGETLSLFGSSLDPASADEVGIVFDVIGQGPFVPATSASSEQLTATVPNTPGFIDVVAYASFIELVNESNTHSVFVTASE